MFIGAQKDDECICVRAHERERAQHARERKRAESRTMKREQGAVHSSACAILIPVSVSIRRPDIRVHIRENRSSNPLTREKFEDLYACNNKI